MRRLFLRFDGLEREFSHPSSSSSSRLPLKGSLSSARVQVCCTSSSLFQLHRRSASSTLTNTQCAALGSRSKSSRFPLQAASQATAGKKRNEILSSRWEWDENRATCERYVLRKNEIQTKKNSRAIEAMDFGLFISLE